MSFFPDIVDGQIVEPDHEKDDLKAIYELLTLAQKAKVDMRVVNDGWTVRKALEEQGILFCNR